MRAYVDTSILTGAYCAEPGSARSQKVLQRYMPVISRLTCLEFSSSVARKLRMKTFSKTEALRVIHQFHSHLQQDIFELKPVQDMHLVLAGEWIDLFATGLRPLDAMHLAIAHSNKLLLVTADVSLAKSARQLGAAVERI
ncbi:MAG: type II toxin-antitoxin system VapC family toxin [Planctomycetota bacterium]|nr:type II toxin-antitoxin system VapC family toxin [Planctomycetota bacterium]